MNCIIIDYLYTLVRFLDHWTYLNRPDRPLTRKRARFTASVSMLPCYLVRYFKFLREHSESGENVTQNGTKHDGNIMAIDTNI